MKTLVIIGVAVIGLLSLSLVNNAFANESAFRAAAAKAWAEIQAHDAQLIAMANDTNSTNSTSGAGAINGSSIIGSSPANDNIQIIN